MKTNHSGRLIALFLLMLFWIIILSTSSSANTQPPSTTVKLIFIHHSVGGNWLAVPNSEQPYGELGTELLNNNYYVSATNYGWGPQGIGDNTNIPDWPGWFTGPDSNTILNALYTENGQNIDGYGDWLRLTTDPGGENEIIMMKPCYPNSDLFGNPTDPAAVQPNEQFTVANAKAVYNNLLTYFATRQDKLFVIITAPPQNETGYTPDYQTPQTRAANARALNNWLVNQWLTSYPYPNVAVFDYFNVLTGIDNHHRWNNGAVEHVTTGSSNFPAYALDEWDSHPNTTGHSKATEEFVPLLNYYYNKWKGGTNPITPVASISANGSAGTVAISATDPVTLTLSLSSGSLAASPADWWLVHLTSTNLSSYNMATGLFDLNLVPVLQSNLMDLNSFSLNPFSGLSAGSHTFCFGFDTIMNGTLDSGSLYYNCVDVQVN